MSALIAHTILDGHLTELVEAPHWYVGFSGGLDSTVLLHLLTQWRSKNPTAPPLTAIYVNHGLQAQSQAWKSHCETVCKQLNVALLCFTVQVERHGKGLEAAAREARYQVMSDQLGPGDVMFLGHHLDAQVDTFFLRLMRGAGLQGLSAMPDKRPLGRGRISRPLLSITRRELQFYADHWLLTSIEDPSNADTTLDRNFLRASVLPLLESRWPGYRRTVARASNHIRDGEQALRSNGGSVETVTNFFGDVGVLQAPLLSMTLQSAGNALRNWLREQGQLPPSHAAMTEFIRQLYDTQRRPNATPRLSCSAYILECFKGAIYLLAPHVSVLPAAGLWLAPEGVLRVTGVGQLSLESTPGPGLRLAPEERLKLGWRVGGERCQPVERSHSSTLKKLFQEYSVPPWWRARVPLLYLGTELLAVGGLWHCKQSRWVDLPTPQEPLYQVRWEPSLVASLD